MDNFITPNEKSINSKSANTHKITSKKRIKNVNHFIDFLIGKRNYINGYV